MNVRSIKETCIYVEDLERSKQFYLNIGLTLHSEEKNRYVFFRAGVTMLLCFRKDFHKLNHSGLPMHGATGKIHLAFEVENSDFDNIKAELKRKGIVIEHEHLWNEKYCSFYFRDPEGNLLEVITPGLWD